MEITIFLLTVYSNIFRGKSNFGNDVKVLSVPGKVIMKAHFELITCSEVESLISELRRAWSATHMRSLGLEELPDSISTNESIREKTHGKLLRPLILLREKVQAHDDVSFVDLFSPFLSVIQSNVTTALPTGAALASTRKLLLAEIISPHHPSAREAVALIVDTVVHCRFEQTDSGADEIAIMWIIETIMTLLQCSAGALLLDEDVWSMMKTIFVVAISQSHADMLRSLAKRALGDLIRCICLNVFSSMPRKGQMYGVPCVIKCFAFFSSIICPSNVSVHVTFVDVSERLDARIVCLELLIDFFESVSRSDPENGYCALQNFASCEPLLALTTDDIFCHLVQICQMQSRCAESSDPLSPAASVASVSGATDLPIPGVEDPNAILNGMALSIRLIVLLLYIPRIRRRLKFQFEVFINSVVLRTLESKKSTNEETNIVLGALRMILADTSLSVDMFVNYDCDFQCSDMLENLFTYLSRFSMPKRLRLNKAVLGEDQILSLKCIVQALSAICARCERGVPILEKGALLVSSSYLSRNEIVRRKKAKATLDRCAKLFNEKPKYGLKELVEAGIIESETSEPHIVAAFLRNTPALDKREIGQFLGERHDFNQNVLKAFVNTFDLSGHSLLSGLRMFLESFRLPGEAQQIDRILQTFAEVAHVSTTDGSSMPSVDCTYLFCFSIIMLNTDLHNPNIRPEKKMSLESFVRNNTNYGPEVSGDVDLGPDFLEGVFNAIKLRQINTMVGGSSLTAEVTVDKWRDLLQRNMATRSENGNAVENSIEFTADELVVHAVLDGTSVCVSSSEHHTRASRSASQTSVPGYDACTASSNDAQNTFVTLSTYDSLIFQKMLRPCVAALSVIFDTAETSRRTDVLKISLEGLLLCAKCAFHFNMLSAFDSVLVSLCKFTTLQRYSASATSISKVETACTDEAFDAHATVANNLYSRTRTQEKDEWSGRNRIISEFAMNQKAQMATMSVFAIVRRYSDSIVLAWNHIVRMILCLSDMNMLTDKVCLESASLSPLDPILRLRFHEAISVASIGAANDRVKHLVDTRESGSGWLASWLFGNEEGDNVQSDSILEAKLHCIAMNDAKRVSEASIRVPGYASVDESSEPGPTFENNDKVDKSESHAAILLTRKCLNSCRVDELITDSSTLSELCLGRFVRALISASGGTCDSKGVSEDSSLMKAPENECADRRDSWLVVGDIESDKLNPNQVDETDIRRAVDNFPPPTEAHIVLCVHIITEVTLHNLHRLMSFWPYVKSHLMQILLSAESPSFIVEKASVGLLRILLKGVLTKTTQNEMFELALQLLSIDERKLTAAFYPLICSSIQSVFFGNAEDLPVRGMLQIAMATLNIKSIPVGYALNIARHIVDKRELHKHISTHNICTILSTCINAAMKRRSDFDVLISVEVAQSMYLLTFDNKAMMDLLQVVHKCFIVTSPNQRIPILLILQNMLLRVEKALSLTVMDWAEIFAAILLPACSQEVYQPKGKVGEESQARDQPETPMGLLLLCLHSKLDLIRTLPDGGFCALWMQIMQLLLAKPAISAVKNNFHKILKDLAATNFFKEDTRNKRLTIRVARLLFQGCEFETLPYEGFRRYAESVNQQGSNQFEDSTDDDNL